LKIEKQSLDNHEVQLNVTVDSEEFAPYMKKAARKIAGSQRIPGFRPGKAPANVIRNMFGEFAVAQEAFDIFLEEKYGDILSEAEVEPGAMGRLEKIDDVINPKFSIIVPLKATVDLGDYREIREDYKEEEVTDGDVEEYVKRMKEPYSSQEPSDGEIEDGNLVFVMIKGDLDEPMEENGTTEIVKEMPYQFVVGADNDEGSAWPYPQFTQCLIGHKEGDVVTSEYTYPEDTPMAALKGKTATYTTTVQSVKKMVLPESDDEFASNFGVDTFKELTDRIRTNLKEEKKQKAENEYIDAIMKQMTEKAKIEFSESELKNEIEDRVNELKENLKQRGLTFESWLKMKKTEEDKFIEDEVKPVAEEQLKRKLILSEFAKKEHIDLNFEKYQQKAQELSTMMHDQIEAIKNRKERQQMINQISENALNEAYLSDVFGRMMAIAKGENPEIEMHDHVHDHHDHDAEQAEAAAKAAAEAAAEFEAEKAAEAVEKPAEE